MSSRGHSRICLKRFTLGAESAVFWSTVPLPGGVEPDQSTRIRRSREPRVPSARRRVLFDLVVLAHRPGETKGAPPVAAPRARPQPMTPVIGGLRLQLI